RTINKSGAGAVQFENVQAAGVNVTAGTVRIRSKPAANDPSNTSLLSTLSIGSTGTFDAGNNSLIVTFTPKSTVEGYIATARDGGAWDRAGLTSSAAAANASTGLGVLSGDEYTSIGGGTGTFAGLTYVAGNTLVKYTWNGDTNFDGKVNFDDYVRTD